MVWLTNDVILISSFTKYVSLGNVSKTTCMCVCTLRGSCRQLSIHSVDNLSQPLSVSEINIAPGLLVPYFDEDINVVFLAAKVCRSCVCMHRQAHAHTHGHTKAKPFICR